MTGLLPFPFQILDIDPEDQAEEDGGHTDLDSQRKGKCVVIKTSTRQVSQPSLHLSAKCMGFTTVVQGIIMAPPHFSVSVAPSLPCSSPPSLPPPSSPLQTYFLPVVGLVEPTELKPGDLVVGW